MSVLARAELLLQAKNYGGSGAWLDEANSHDAQFGSTGGADTNDPLWLAHTGIQHVYFPGSADNSVSAVLAVTTIYDYTVTYLDDTTATGSETSDGGGVLVLGEAQANFAGLKVKLIDVTADGGGATLALFDASGLTEPFASYTDGIPEVWTLNRSATGRKLTVVDRPMFLLGTDDYFLVADHANLDSAAGEDITVLVAFRIYATAAAFGRLVAKSDDINFHEIFMDTGVDPPRIQARLDDNVTVVNSVHVPQITYGVSTVGAYVRDAGVTLSTYLDGVLNSSGATVDATGDLSNASVLAIGASPWGGNQLDVEIHAVVLWQEAPTVAEIVTATVDIVLGFISGVTAVVDSDIQITVSWDDLDFETGYRVERSDDGVAGWVDVSGVLAADVTSYADSGLDPDTLYYYRVVPFNDVGDGTESSVVSATTEATPSSTIMLMDVG